MTRKNRVVAEVVPDVIPEEIAHQSDEIGMEILLRTIVDPHYDTKLALGHSRFLALWKMGLLTADRISYYLTEQGIIRGGGSHMGNKIERKHDVIIDEEPTDAWLAQQEVEPPF